MPFIEIQFKGRIDPVFLDWFQGMTIKPISEEVSCLSSGVTDNSAIYGLISSLSSLGLTLISVSVREQDDENR